MAAIAPPLYLFDLGNPNGTGLYGSLYNDTLISSGTMFRGDRRTILVGLVQRAQPGTVTGGRIWDYVDPTGSAVALGIGSLDQTPTAGTFAASYNGSSTGLTTLAYNISAVNLATALNANAAFTAGGFLATVTLLDTGFYEIKMNQVGARFPIGWDGTNLTPQSAATGSVIVTGDSTHIDVQTLKLLQRPYAYNDTWSAAPVASATITQIQTGSSTATSIQRITLDVAPFDGSFVITLDIDGDSRSATVNYNFNGQQFTTRLNGNETDVAKMFSVSTSAPFSWDIAYNAFGARPAMTYDLSGLKVPLTLEGTINLATEQMNAAFGALDEIEALLELQYTPSGGDSWTVYQGSEMIKKDLLDFSTILPNPAVDYLTEAQSDVRYGLQFSVDTTLNIPGEYATFELAWDHATSRRIAPGVTVTIQFADGTYNFGNDRFSLNAEFGEQIRILGNTSTPANVVLNFDGPATPFVPTNGYPEEGWAAFCVSNGNSINLIDGLTMMGPGISDPSCVDFMGIMGWNGATITCGTHMVIGDFYSGLCAWLSSSIFADGAKVFGGGDGNVWSFGASSIYFRDGESYGASTFFAQAGLLADNLGMIFAQGADVHDNGINGCLAISMGFIELFGASVHDNINGITTGNGGYAEFASITLSSNTNDFSYGGDGTRELNELRIAGVNPTIWLFDTDGGDSLRMFYSGGILTLFRTSTPYGGVVSTAAAWDIFNGDMTLTRTLKVGGGLSAGYVAKTASYAVTINDYTVDLTSGTATFTLPTAVGNSGKIFNLKNSGGTLTAGTTSAQTIDGSTTQPVGSGGNLQVQSTGANWIIL